MGNANAEAPPVPQVVAKTPPKYSSAPRTNVGWQQERLAWMLVAPSILVVCAVAIYPLIESFRLSFTNLRPTRPGAEEYIGFENHRRLFADDLFWSSLKNTMIFTVSSVTLETVFGMIVALTIHSNFRGRGIVRTSMLVPWAIPTVVSSLLWQWMLHDTFGVINSILVRLRLMDPGTNFSWINDTTTAPWARSWPLTSGKPRRSWPCSSWLACRSSPLTCMRRPASTAPASGSSSGKLHCHC
jgi:hypothetical protein